LQYENFNTIFSDLFDTLFDDTNSGIEIEGGKDPFYFPDKQSTFRDQSWWGKNFSYSSGKFQSSFINNFNEPYYNN
jgi:hypothetical protein